MSNKLRALKPVASLGGAAALLTVAALARYKLSPKRSGVLEDRFLAGTNGGRGVFRQELLDQLLHPGKVQLRIPGSVAGKKMNAVVFTNPVDGELHWLLYLIGRRSSITSPTVIGNVKMQLEAGWSPIVFEPLGSGASDNHRRSLQGMCDDAEAALRFCLEYFRVGHDQVTLYGASLGTGVLAELFQRTKEDFAGLILQSGFPSMWKAICRICPPLNWLYSEEDFPGRVWTLSGSSPVALHHQLCSCMVLEMPRYRSTSRIG